MVSAPFCLRAPASRFKVSAAFDEGAGGWGGWGGNLLQGQLEQRKSHLLTSTHLLFPSQLGEGKKKQKKQGTKSQSFFAVPDHCKRRQRQTVARGARFGPVTLKTKAIIVSH